MTIREAIDRVDGIQANQYSNEDKVLWLSMLDSRIYTDIILDHHKRFCEAPKHFTPYTTDNMDKALLADFPYDELYIAYLEMKIDEANKETARYNNSAILFNNYYENYEKHYHKTHMPIAHQRFRIWG